MAKPAVGYVRVCTSQQGRSGLGLEAQEAALARFAQAEGFDIITMFAEIDLQKTDWRAKPFETYLPPPISVPGLDLDIRTKPPKRDVPIGWQANAPLLFQLRRSPTDARISLLDLGRI